MSAADFEELRDSCTEAWAFAELGRARLEPRKNLYRQYGLALGIVTIVLGGLNTADAIELLGRIPKLDSKIIGIVFGILTIIVGGMITLFDPRQKSARAKEAWMLLGTKQRALATLVDEARQRVVRGTDNGTRHTIWNEIVQLLDENDVPSAGRAEKARQFESECTFKSATWRGTYIGDDSPTSEEADDAIVPIGGGA